MASKTEAKALRKFGIVDKLAYAAGDFGCNMSFGLKSYLTIFWTQFMGIDQVLMAGLLLLVQVWDAINDPIIGAMVDTDKHHYKRNKFLAYINVGGWGLLVGGAMCFIPWQGAPAMAKNILFVAGYIIWDAFYTVANVPYGSLLGMITDDPTGRAQLSTWRNVGACVAGILTGIILPYLIYDATNNMMGNRLFWIALILGGVGVVSFQYLVRKTVIRVDADVKVGEDAPKFNVLTACKNFMRNRAIVGITLAIVVGFIQFYGASTAMTVMFQSYFHNVQISGLLGYLSYVGIFLYVPFIGKITPKLGKKEGSVLCAVGMCISYGLLFVLPITPDGKGLALYTLCMVLGAVAGGYYNCINMAMVSDAIDYGEWKFGERNEGTNYALHSFFRKLAQGVFPSAGILLATWLGYDATLGADQPMAVASNMRYLVAGLYLLTAVLTLISVGLIYNLDKKTMATVTTDLEKRHAMQKQEG